MEKFINGHFYNPSKGNLTIFQVVEEIFLYIQERPERFYDIVVGCDSSSSEEPCFPLVVVVLRKGEGGRFFIKKIHYASERKFYSWRQRILNEVMLSCEFALFLKESIDKKSKELPDVLNFDFRYIHADVGENGQTKDMIKEVAGLIRGNGFEPKIKPESYVASVVADRFT